MRGSERRAATATRRGRPPPVVAVAAAAAVTILACGLWRACTTTAVPPGAVGPGAGAAAPDRGGAGAGRGGRARSGSGAERRAPVDPAVREAVAPAAAADAEDPPPAARVVGGVARLLARAAHQQAIQQQQWRRIQLAVEQNRRDRENGVFDVEVARIRLERALREAAAGMERGEKVLASPENGRDVRQAVRGIERAWKELLRSADPPADDGTHSGPRATGR